MLEFYKKKNTIKFLFAFSKLPPPNALIGEGHPKKWQF